MIVTSKVEIQSRSWADEKHIYTILDEPVEVILTRNRREWIGLTDKLKRGMYQCKFVFHLKWKGLGEEVVVIDRDKGTDQPLYVIAE